MAFNDRLKIFLKSRPAKITSALFSMFVLIFATLYLYRIWQVVTWDEIKNAFNAISLSHILIAIFLTVINYAVMIGYDWFGLRYAGANPKIGRTA
ncbi:MAG TPA: hypothetical protein VHP36_08415, partial [Chitinispirillaceae bacterium]|nr:hypothetical protein [Chitinispirillaceae bacterium]